MKTQDTTHSEQQAQAQLESILEMVKGLNSRNDDERDEAQQQIQEDALSVEVRSDWHCPGPIEAGDDGNVPTEYRICLCTGGPACQLRGDLSKHGEPETARLEHQDWGTQWTEYGPAREHEDELLAYARCFYFGD